MQTNSITTTTTS